MAEKRGMGRGLSAILSVTAEDAAAAGPSRDELRDIAVADITPNPNQPRKRFDEEALQGLADSLGERGVLQPVLVRPAPGGGGGFELVAGERRWRAAQAAGLRVIPAIVRDRDDAATLEDALVENVARENLNPVEEARAVAGLVEELGLTREAVGKRIGRSRVAVSNLLRILDLPDEALDLLESGALTEGHGRALLMAEDHGDRRRLARAAAEAGWSVRVVEEKARRANDPVREGSKGRAAIHPDQAAAVDDIAQALGGALGVDVKVRPRGTGYRVELTFDTPDEAVALAERLAAVVR